MTNRTHSYLATVCLLSALAWGGAGGCGGNANSGSTNANTPAASATAAGSGSIAGLTTGLTSALQAAAAQSQSAAGLTVESETNPTSGDTSGDGGDVACSPASGGGSSALSMECEDGDATDTSGSSSSEFEHEPVVSSCDNADGSTGSTATISDHFTQHLENFRVEDCDKHLTLTGDVSGTVDGTIDECRDTRSLTITVQTADACDGITVTDEDGTTHQVGFELTIVVDGDQRTTTGTICIDGVSQDASTLDMQCQEIEDSGDGTAGEHSA